MRNREISEDPEPQPKKKVIKRYPLPLDKKASLPQWDLIEKTIQFAVNSFEQPKLEEAT
jgi:hypothetical protein